MNSGGPKKIGKKKEEKYNQVRFCPNFAAQFKVA